MEASTQITQKIVALHNCNEYILTRESDILKCHSCGNYTEVTLVNGKKILLSKTLKEVENSLSQLWFCRIHHSHLINLRHAVKLLKKDGLRVQMRDGKEVVVSRSRKKHFMERVQVI